jgi:inner membrane protein YhjD
VINRLLGVLDRFQQRHTVTAFPFAVVKKFGDDRAGRLAALVAYYGFFSLFPLLLVVVTIVGFVLDDRSAQELQDSALSQIPVIGAQIARQVDGLSGSVPALVIGLLTALWAGLGCMQAAQDAMNEVWNLPRSDNPSYFGKRLRSLLALLVVGLLLVASGVAAQLPVLLGGSLPARAAGVLAAVLIGAGVYLLAFRVLASVRHGWRALVPGAVLAGAGYTVLQLVGRWYVERTVNDASDVYGTFAVVIGLLAWLYLLAQLSLYAAEVNVVLERRLWPRAIRLEEPTTADREVVEATARAARLRRDTEVTVRFEDAPADESRTS